MRPLPFAAEADTLMTALNEAAIKGDLEMVELIEADIAGAVRRLWRGAGPMLRRSIANTVRTDH